MAPIPLTQELFEALWTGHSPHPNGPLPNHWLILFSSATCAPCARLDKAAIEETSHAAGYTFFICDAKINKYTPVYCDITRYPTFQLMEPGRLIGTLTSSDTAAVLEWLAANSPTYRVSE